MCRIKYVISIPEDFEDRFLSLISNINAVNTDRGTSKAPVKIESITYEKPPEPAAVPKEEGEDIENSD